MEKAVTYFDLAENDYKFLYHDYIEGRVGNIMCYAAQNVCERYLKHIIDRYCKAVDTTSVLRTHSLKVLKKFIVQELPDFSCDWSIIMQADSYYFSTRYPGEDSFIVEKDDVDECWEAVEETRRTCLSYIEGHGTQLKSIADNEEVIKALSEF